jgi:hypothetical protein
MTAILCKTVHANFASASKTDEFFSQEQQKKIKEFGAREQPLQGSITGCKTNLYFGFFFDGTKNNYVLAENNKTHSNVARLYDCYPGMSVPGVLPQKTDWEYNPSRYTHFFRTYIPGVGSPFDGVNDTGHGLDLQRGLASGHLGAVRIAWALLQAINHVHRYFLKAPLLTPEEVATFVKHVRLDKKSRPQMLPPGAFSDADGGSPDDQRTRLVFEQILVRLHTAVAQHWPDKKTGRPPRIDPGIVQKIHISIFGFSRGATQARAYTNWLMSLCRLDAHLCEKGDTMTLGGFAVSFDFLGLFDTVASVGASNTLGNSLAGKMFDGHGAWADAEESLRIPDNITCVHLVAAHELRRSFPLDSISVKGVTTANCTEIVFPGVHSDLGCGYAPGEQGRGRHPTGKDMLARIPLLVMYQAARLAGVPLKLELASAIAKERFEVAPETINAFNAYVAACATKNGTLTAIMREQAHYQMQWRLLRRNKEKLPLEATDSYKRASTFDQNDLRSANLEFETEIAQFNDWLSDKDKQYRPAQQDPGFDNDYENEWEEIARWWNARPPLAGAIASFFDEYVHDSRAWFKLIPGHPDNEADTIELLKKWDAKRVKFIDENTILSKRFAQNHPDVVMARRLQNVPRGAVPDGLTDAQRTAAEEYARTRKIPSMTTSGREPLLSSRGGYLRYRKIYGGWDSELISRTETVQEDHKNVA